MAMKQIKQKLTKERKAAIKQSFGVAISQVKAGSMNPYAHGVCNALAFVYGNETIKTLG